VSLKPHLSGRPVVVSTRFDQYGDLAQAPPGGVSQPKAWVIHFRRSPVATAEGICFLVTYHQLGSDVSRGRFVRQRSRSHPRESLWSTVTYWVFVTVSGEDEVSLSATYGRDGLRGPEYCSGSIGKLEEPEQSPGVALSTISTRASPISL